MKPAVFFERDGILNLARIEKGMPIAPLTNDTFITNPEAIPALKHLKAAGFLLIATTNQPGLSAGALERRELDRMHTKLKTALPLDDILFCPHAPDDGCGCRKPLTGLFTEARHKWHIGLERSFVVSDKWQDAQAARDIGATSLLLWSPWLGTGHHDLVFTSLSEIAAKILQLQARKMAA